MARRSPRRSRATSRMCRQRCSPCLRALQVARHLGQRSASAARRLRSAARQPGVRRFRIARHAISKWRWTTASPTRSWRRSTTVAIGRGTTMPHATTDDGVRLYYEETGSGRPVIFVHEYAGDYRSWEPQMRHFGQRYRAITYNARGYPPSDVPEEVAKYSQARAADDISVGARSSEDRQGACRRPVDGRLRHAAFRLPPSVARAVAVRRGLRLRRRTRPDREVPRRGGDDCRVHPGAGDGGVRREIRLWPDARAVREQGPARLRRVQAHAGGTLGAGRAQHAAWACSASGRRCTTWSIR